MCIIVLSGGRKSVVDAPHSIIMMFWGSWRLSDRSSSMMPGSGRR